MKERENRFRGMDEESLELVPDGGLPEEIEAGREVKEEKEQPKPSVTHPENLSKEELLQKIKELQELSEKNYDLYLRSQAEMENMKKRIRKEKEDWLKYSNETLIKQILPIMDSLEKAISHSSNDKALQALTEGVELTLKGLQNALGKAGVEEIKAEGEPFDPSFHEAVSQIEDDHVEAGRVVQEIQKGYTLNKRLLRPAMVVVNKGKQTG
jgi:molecular chaperone GrpE